MFADILVIIKKAGIFLILGQTILHLCAGEAYEKYIRMLVGMITAVLIIAPIAEFIQKESYQSFEEYRTRYEEELFGTEADFEQIRDEKWSEYFMEEAGSGQYEGED